MLIKSKIKYLNGVKDENTNFSRNNKHFLLNSIANK